MRRGAHFMPDGAVQGSNSEAWVARDAPKIARATKSARGFHRLGGGGATLAARGKPATVRRVGSARISWSIWWRKAALAAREMAKTARNAGSAHISYGWVAQGDACSHRNAKESAARRGAHLVRSGAHFARWHGAARSSEISAQSRVGTHFAYTRPCKATLAHQRAPKIARLAHRGAHLVRSRAHIAPHLVPQGSKKRPRQRAEPGWRAFGFHLAVQDGTRSPKSAQVAVFFPISLTFAMGGMGDPDGQRVMRKR